MGRWGDAAMETRRRGDGEMRGPGDAETGRCGDAVLRIAGVPPALSAQREQR